MKKLLIILLLIVGCADNSISSKEDIGDDKIEALDFSLKVIESIVKQDIASLKIVFPDSIYLLDGDGFIPMSDNLIEIILLESHIDSNITMADYYNKL